MAYSSKKQSWFWSNVREVTVLLLIVFLVRTFGFGLYQVPTGSMETTMLVGERFFADKFTPLFSNVKRGDIIAFNDPLFKYSPNKLGRLFQDYVWGPSNWTKRVIALPGETVKGVIENGKPVLYVNDKKLEEPYINKYPLLQLWKVDFDEFQRLVRSGASNSYLSNLITLKSYDPSKGFDQQQFYNIKPDRIYIDPETSKNVMIYPGSLMRKSESLKHKSKGEGNNYWDGSDEFRVKLGENQYWVMGDNRLGSKDSRVFGPIGKRLIHGKILFRIWSVDSDENWWIWDFIKHPIDFLKRVRWGRFFQRVR